MTPPSTATAIRAALRTTGSSIVQRLKTRVGESRGNPVDIYHEIHGRGKHKILFITGWAGSCDNWKFQTDFFGSHPDFQVCIYENRGSGFSSSPPRDYRMSDMARDAAELLHTLRWDRVHVVGVSMGGMIAQELALLLPPARIGSLTLASTSAGRSLPPAKHMPWVAAALARVALGMAEVKDVIGHLLYSREWLEAPAPRGSGLRSNLEYMKKFHGGRTDSRPPQSITSAIAQLLGIIQHHVSPTRLRLLRSRLAAAAPALVVHGTEDVLVHLKSAWRLSRELGARLVVFEGRGHALNHEDREGFNGVLLRHFVEAVEGGGKTGRARVEVVGSDGVAKEAEEVPEGVVGVADGGDRAMVDAEVLRKLYSLAAIPRNVPLLEGLARLEWVPPKRDSGELVTV
ncbi:hypothetical protein HDU96_004401 [Phlyctochytrium bullatum]|nr:hypothetical protein HDU96_004401 [Phlyctochytrium bullatum]